ncbi:MAG: leucine-rich repeat domain-containing protein, partial [Promethearchaeota archaeon]
MYENNLIKYKEEQIFIKNGQLDLSDKAISNIFEIEAIQSYTNLKELILDHNLITEIQGLDKLKKLTTLSLEYNEITEISGLDKLENLKSLYLGANQTS